MIYQCLHHQIVLVPRVLQKILSIPVFDPQLKGSTMLRSVDFLLIFNMSRLYEIEEQVYFLFGGGHVIVQAIQFQFLS